MELNPLLIVPEKRIKIGYDSYTTNAPSPACVEKQGKWYVIRIFEMAIKELFDKSFINQYITYDMFKFGFLLHEIAHIKYSEFYEGNDKCFAYILNLLEDIRVEYNLVLDYPAYSKYLYFINMATKQTLCSQNPGTSENESALINKLDNLYKLVRFDKFEDNELTNFCLSYIISSKRLTAQNCMQAASIIHDYIIDDNKLTKLTTKYESIDSNYIKEQKLEKIEDKVKGLTSIDIGTNEFIFEDGINDFYRKVISEEKEMINKLRRIFNVLFESINMTKSYDGDINIKKQQDLYVNSLIGEDGKNYIRMERNKKSLDLILCRDVSGSTGSYSEDYAKSIICILAAVEGIKGIRTCEIEFSSGFQILKRFEDKLQFSKIYPYAHGGTEFYNTIQKIKQMEWKADKRLVIVVSDGQIDNWCSCLEVIKEIKKTKVDFIFVNVGCSLRQIGFIPCEFKNLHEVLYKEIVKIVRG